MKFYTYYNKPPQSFTPVGDGSMTCQEFKDECDINNIVKLPNYGINPLNPPTVKPSFDDFSKIELQDFHYAQSLIADAAQKFELLSSDIRKRFNNNPAELIAFCNDDNNYDEAIKFGMIDKSDNVTEMVTSPQNASSEVVSDGPETSPHI